LDTLRVASIRTQKKVLINPVPILATPTSASYDAYKTRYESNASLLKNSTTNYQYLLKDNSTCNHTLTCNICNIRSLVVSTILAPAKS